MRADLKQIQPNDHPSWDDFVAAFRSDSGAQSAWFSVEVGPDDGQSSGEWFQVLVCTHSGAAEIQKKRERSRYVVTDVFSPNGILSALREHLTRAQGDSWFELRETLRKSMWWEREVVRV